MGARSIVLLETGRNALGDGSIVLLGDWSKSLGGGGGWEHSFIGGLIEIFLGVLRVFIIKKSKLQILTKIPYKTINCKGQLFLRYS